MLRVPVLFSSMITFSDTVLKPFIFAVIRYVPPAGDRIVFAARVASLQP